MLTVREAQQRNAANGVIMRRANPGSTEWRVTLAEWTRDMCERAAYFTDDLEDAVLTGASMRRKAV